MPKTLLLADDSVVIQKLVGLSFANEDVELVTTDNGAVARGFGAFGIQVGDSRDLPDAIRQAQASGLPAVIDVLIDRGPSPDDWRADARRAGET